MSVEKIKIKDEFIKLDNFIKFGGIASTGGHAKVLVQGGFIKVNGEICTQRGKKMRIGDQAEYEGKIIEVC